MNTQNPAKRKLLLFGAVLSASLGLVAASGCSTLGIGGGKSTPELAASGPTVLNARAEPGTVELNRDLQPTKDAQVVADVKDFRNTIDSVKLRFKEAPIELSMENIGGTTWRGTLTPQQLQLLAVSGKTVSYTAEVIAHNDAGQVATSSEPLKVAVKTPDLSKPEA